MASTIFHMSSITQHWLIGVPAGASPFSHSPLIGWGTSEHLHYIASVWWETRHWWESQRERETRKRIRGGRAMLPEMEGSQQYLNGQARSVFLCSHTCTRRSAPECLPWYHGNPPFTDLLIRCSVNSSSAPPPLLITSNLSVADGMEGDVWLWKMRNVVTYKEEWLARIKDPRSLPSDSKWS